MNQSKFLLITLAACAALASCTKTAEKKLEGGQPAKSEAPQAAAFIEDVDAAAAAKLIEAPQPPVVLDIRTPEEFAAGHIEGAVNVDFKGADFKAELGKLDRDQPYLLHCRSGSRSTSSKPVFTELGFKSIYHLDGGINAWEAAGLPTVK